MSRQAVIDRAFPTGGLASRPLPLLRTVVPATDMVDRLSRSLRLSAIAGGCGILGLVPVYLLLLRSPWILGLLLAAVLHQLVLVLVRRTCRAGAVATAALLFCVTDWLMVLVALVVIPAAAPALVPIIIARVVSTLPYLDRSALLHLVWVSLGTGVVVGLLSQVDLVGVQEQVPGWVVTAFVAFFVPVGFAIVGLDLWQHSATLLETAQRAVNANARLRASEQALAEQSEQLRRSRARLVAAADLERRRVERDLHDGAQQTLIGLCLGVSLLAERHPDSSDVGAELRTLERAAQAAVTELRELAHGVYPPVLASQGLAPAVQAVLRRSRLQVRAHVEQVARRPPEQEAAVYFTCREALQNVEKHAGPGVAVLVTLTEDRTGGLCFSVVDDGRGFDPAAAQGHGMVNMRDRMAAVGGELRVRSSLDGGTCISGTLPADGSRTAGSPPVPPQASSR